MFLTAITFFVLLSILVFVHELGHYMVAKFIGVDVEEFGFGLPPRIFGKKVGKTVYSLNWLPIGGFVRLAGEDDVESESSNLKVKNKKHYFWARSKKERAAILVAGVAMNFALAVVLTAFLLTQGVHEPAGRVHIEKIVSGSPAQKAGLVVGDVVTSVSYMKDGKKEEQKLTTTRELIDTTRSHSGEQIGLLVVREGKSQEITLVPRKEFPEGEGPMGIAISDLEIRRYSLGEAPVAAVRINLTRAGQMIYALASTIWKLITFTPVGAEVAGPIGIAQVTGQAVRYGFFAVLEFASILSLNLAVLNILPIPALDGGRLLFVFVEKLLGRKVRPTFEKSTHQIGMIILLGLMLLVTVNDILRLARGS